MNGPFDVRYTLEAKLDLDRLLDFLGERELRLNGSLDLAFDALDAVVAMIDGQLRRAPFTCRKVGADPMHRELVIPFGATVYVALFDINPDRTIDVLAVRHQREDDYH